MTINLSVDNRLYAKIELLAQRLKISPSELVAFYPKSGSWVCAMLVTPLIYGVFAQYRVSPVG